MNPFKFGNFGTGFIVLENTKIERKWPSVIENDIYSTKIFVNKNIIWHQTEPGIVMFHFESVPKANENKKFIHESQGLGVILLYYSTLVNDIVHTSRQIGKTLTDRCVVDKKTIYFKWTYEILYNGINATRLSIWQISESRRNVLHKCKQLIT